MVIAIVDMIATTAQPYTVDAGTIAANVTMFVKNVRMLAANVAAIAAILRHFATNMSPSHVGHRSV